MESKCSDQIADFLAEKGIRHVFGIIGSGNAHIFDSITKKGFTEIVCVHHEQAAVMAMMIYTRTTGTLSASLLTTGAGSTNGVTGVVSAWMDSVPGIIISGNENSKFTYPENPVRIWGIQGYDSVEMVKKVTKYAQRIMDPKQIRYELEKAYDISSSGRPGPVWIDVPMNIQAAPVDPAQLTQYKPDRPPTSSSTQAIKDPTKAAQEVAKKMATAQRPVIWLGNGIRWAEAEHLVRPLLDRFQAAALVSWAGIDLVDSNHPRVFGRAGVYGQRCANFVLQNCDFLLTIGTRLAVPQVGYDLSEFARAAEIAQVDIDEAEAVKHGNRVRWPIAIDARVFMEALLKETDSHGPYEFAGWLKQCQTYREKYPWIGPEHNDPPGFINSYRFMDRLNSHLKADQIVVTDMGTALLSGHQALKLKEGQRLMTSTGLGEMGFGLPAALGASFARDRGEVMCLNCDGGMMMNLQELQTIAHHQLPIKIIIFNNDGYLMIKHTQKALFKGRYSGTDQKSGVSCPDFTKLAKAFDFPSYQIRTWEDFDRVMPQLQAEKGPAICEVFMHPEQYFYPKLGLAPQKDGSILSPPLEDLTPFISRKDLREAMIVGMHPKSEKIEA
jgi:acetolactate synthase-1/2/3 large subunit